MKRKLLLWGGIIVCGIALWIGTIVLAISITHLRVPVNLPGMLVYATPGYAVATGTWIIEGDRMANPLQTTKITCRKETMLCDSSTAEISDRRMMLNADRYEISEWTKTHVVFSDDSPLCVSYIYTLNWATKSVTGVRTKKKSLPPNTTDCNTLQSELRLTMKDGFRVSGELEREAMPWFGTLAFLPFKLLH